MASRKHVHLFAYLWLNRQQPQSRERIAGLLWRESSEENARKNLRQSLHQIKKVLQSYSAENLLLNRRTNIQFDAQSTCWIDVEEFQSHFRQAQNRSEAERAESFRNAVELYRGDFVEDCYDDWCREMQAELKDLYYKALLELAQYHGQRDEYDLAIEYSKRLLMKNPMLEEVHRELIRLHFANGDRAAALRQYQECKRLLKRELNVEPMQETKALIKQIRQRPSQSEERLSELQKQSTPSVLPVDESLSSGQETATFMVLGFGGQGSLEKKNEAPVIQLIQELQSHISPIFREHQGRVIRTTGNSSVVEFQDAIEAVLCALQIQHLMHERYSPYPSGGLLQLQIGVHIGQIEEREGNAEGGASDVAAQIQPLAEPGGICITEDVARQVRTKPGIVLESLGTQELQNSGKKIELFQVILPRSDGGKADPESTLAKASPKKKKIAWFPVRVLGVIVLMTVMWWMASPFFAVGPPIANEVTPVSIAVLPFDNLTSDPENEYFSDGMTDEILNALSKLQGLRVISHTSVFVYKGKQFDLRTIGQDLNVTHVLEGSVRKEEGKIRVSVRLNRVSDDSQIWSETYERDISDVFKIQDDISRRVVDSLKAKLSATQQGLQLNRETENLDAYNFFLQGRYLVNNGTEGGLNKGLEYFKQALQVDPNYAMAYASLAYYYARLAMRPGEYQNWYPKAKEAAAKALEIDDTLAEAHTALAEIKTVDEDDFAGAEKELKQAIELNPNYAIAYQEYAKLLWNHLGRPEEAVAAIKQAVNLDPLTLSVRTVAIFIFQTVGQFDKAMEQAQKALELDPNSWGVHQSLAALKENTGDLKGAEEEWKRTIELNPQASSYWSFGNFLSRIGRYDEAHLEYQKVLQINPIPPNAYQYRAWVKEEFLDWNGAEQELKAQSTLAPNDEYISLAYVRYLSTVGRTEEGLAELRKDLMLHPMSPALNGEAAYYYFIIRQYDRSLDEYRQMAEQGISTQIDAESYHRTLAYIDWQKGMDKEGVEEDIKAWMLDTATFEYPLAEFRKDFAVFADQLREEFKANGLRGYLSKLSKFISARANDKCWTGAEKDDVALAAATYALIKDVDHAVECLIMAYERYGPEDAGMTLLGPAFDGIRSDPTFDSLPNEWGLKNR
ncbi:hypothetical protein HYR53_00450 [Candidatus Acetothermia bacterium]|nr:hypothetical protein [Candidatus Acetothermia bacterium]